MRVILSRHGNTFGPGDKVVMAGLKNDLPLVEKGGEQAETLADALLKEGVIPDVICCGELKRHKRYAQIVMEKLGIPGEPIIDARVNELDYGGWTGLSDNEIEAQFGTDARLAWQKKCVWPQGDSNWGSNPELISSDVKAFFKDLNKFCKDGQTALVVTSGGTLRFFLQVVDGAYEKAIDQGTLKVSTGNICKISVNENTPQIEYWNINPQEIVDGKRSF